MINRCSENKSKVKGIAHENHVQSLDADVEGDWASSGVYCFPAFSVKMNSLEKHPELIM